MEKKNYVAPKLTTYGSLSDLVKRSKGASASEAHGTKA